MFDDTEFRYETELQVRVRDLDHMGHVNNAMYATYMEQARTDYFGDVLNVGLDDLEMAVVSSHIEFKRQVRYGGGLTVQVRVPQLGRTSFPLEYRFLDDGEAAATARTVQVSLDSENDTACPLPDLWRMSIVEHEDLSEEDGTVAES
ncbi:acyl-CoA thioesterase [Halomarina halobia]|uniref:Acyl-CoA thioesterase n=1 Tax=Halomarina halobia TaxID=3033386 RepID=A0ABD6AEX1_9EURY|nr:thioesterase family protein [Halomarina sp. PSR21]